MCHIYSHHRVFSLELVATGTAHLTLSYYYVSLYLIRERMCFEVSAAFLPFALYMRCELFCSVSYLCSCCTDPAPLPLTMPPGTRVSSIIKQVDKQHPCGRAHKTPPSHITLFSYTLFSLCSSQRKHMPHGLRFPTTQLRVNGS